MSIFPMEKREAIKTEMLDVGIKLIKQKGMQHITVSEITKRTGIGKGTFYHFYQSKEEFLYEVITYSKEKIYHELNKVVEEKGGIDRKSFEKIFRLFSFENDNNIISFITTEDEIWLAKKLTMEIVLNPSKEEAIIQNILVHSIGVREDINYHVLANMMKIMAFMVENKELLHQDAIAENLRLLEIQIMDYIYVKEEE